MRKLYIAIYLALALAPGAAMLLRVPDHRIDGVYPPAPRLPLTLESVRSEAYQAAFTSWFEQSLGLRAWEVWADNTALLHAFGETKYGARVAVGDDGVLFERDDLDFFNRDAVKSAAWVAQLADDLALVQQRLAARGQAFVPVFVPSKTTLYRDAVPAKWTRAFAGPRPAEAMMRALKAELDRRGVKYADGIARLTESQLPREQLWGRDARHFSAMAGCLVDQLVLAEYEAITGKHVEYPCVARKVPNARREHSDLDLFRLLNAWGARRDREVYEVDHPVIVTPPDAPTALWIATSFAWVMEIDAVQSHRFRQAWVDFYNNTIYLDGYDGSWPTRPHTTGWRDVMLTRDLTVLELNESYVTMDDWFGVAAVQAMRDELR